MKRSRSSRGSALRGAEALAAVELDPESFFVHWILQSNYTLAGRYPEAIATGHAALAVSERHPLAMMTMGQTYADWGKRTEARPVRCTTS